MSKDPHDRFVKYIWEDAKRARTMLMASLPAQLAKQCDWEQLETESGSYMDASLEATHSDLLYRTRIGERAALMYCVFEHKSRSDELTVLQTQGYVLRVLERHVRRKDGPALPLPVVIPIVLHHSETGWQASTELLPLFGDLGGIEPGVVEYLPAFRFVLNDLSHKTDQELRESALDWVSLLAMWVLRDARRGDAIREGIGRWADVVREVQRAPEGGQALTAVFRYILEVASVTAEELEEAVVKAVPEAKETVMTGAEQLRTEGRAEGLLLGEAGVLLRLLSRKFGDLPEAVKTKVENASREQLDVWVERILSADSLEAVFAE